MRLCSPFEVLCGSEEVSWYPPALHPICTPGPCSGQVSLSPGAGNAAGRAGQGADTFISLPEALLTQPLASPTLTKEITSADFPVLGNTGVSGSTVPGASNQNYTDLSSISDIQTPII